MKEIYSVNSDRATARENAVVKNFDELGRVKEGGTGGGSVAW